LAGVLIFSAPFSTLHRHMLYFVRQKHIKPWWETAEYCSKHILYMHQ